MSVYSYTAKQLSEKVAPKKPFWTGKKIAAIASLSLLSLFVALVASAPPSPVVAVEPQATVVKEEPKPQPKVVSVKPKATQKVAPQPKPEAISAETRRQLEEHFELSQLNSDRAAGAAWDRAYVEARKDACQRKQINSALC